MWNRVPRRRARGARGPAARRPRAGAPAGLQLQLPEFGLGLSTAEVRRLNRATLGVPALPLPREGEDPPRRSRAVPAPRMRQAVRLAPGPEQARAQVPQRGTAEVRVSARGMRQAVFERKLLVAHERTHTDERPFACPHPGCDKAFRARNALAHTSALHAETELLRCGEEGCRFSTKKKTRSPRSCAAAQEKRRGEGVERESQGRGARRREDREG